MKTKEILRDKELKRLVICFLSLFLLVSCAQNEYSAEYSSRQYTLSMRDGNLIADVPWVVNIEKDSAKDFVILNLTDIQFSDTEYIRFFDSTADMITELVSNVKPDLITYTGDFSYGNMQSFYGICSFIESFGIPWAPVFGNHDFNSSSISIDGECRVLEHFKHCLFKRGPENLAFCEDEKGIFEQTGNYVLNIYEKDGNDYTIVKSLIMIDTGNDGITGLQTKWYADCVKSVKTTYNASSAVFMHMPVMGFYGYSDDFCNCAEQLQSTDLMVAGHFHYMSSKRVFNGITYQYGLKTGQGCDYTGVGGGTKIILKGDGSFSIEHVYETDL